MKRIIFIYAFLICTPFCLFSQFRNGVVLEMADSWVRRQASMYTRPDDPYTPILESDKWHPSFSFNIGYKIQYESKRYMYDLSLAYQNRGIGVTFIDETEKQTTRLQSVGMTISVNRFVWNRLFVGIGACPSYYWDNRTFNNKQKTYWDIAAMGQIGFDFQFMQVSVFYKNGFKPVLEYLKSTQRVYTRDFGISVFVPLKF
ncbi:MAG: hypothetical protein RR202_07610 [Bacteroidales bacterium]